MITGLPVPAGAVHQEAAYINVAAGRDKVGRQNFPTDFHRIRHRTKACNQRVCVKRSQVRLQYLSTLTRVPVMVLAQRVPPTTSAKASTQPTHATPSLMVSTFLPNSLCFYSFLFPPPTPPQNEHAGEKKG